MRQALAVSLVSLFVSSMAQECVADIEARSDKSTDEFPDTYEVTLAAGASCTHDVLVTAKVEWDSSEFITVKTDNYRNPDSDESGCQLDASNQDYYQGQMLYTKDTPFPYNEDDTCKWVITIRNDDQTASATFDLYTNDG